MSEWPGSRIGYFAVAICVHKSGYGSEQSSRILPDRGQHAINGPEVTRTDVWWVAWVCAGHGVVLIGVFQNGIHQFLI